MVVEKIYIARHGFRLNWLTNNWTSPTGLARDVPLAAYGETQAQELAQYFLSLPEDERPTAIFSSPYYRCLQTSQPTANKLNIPLYVDHGLSEWYSPVSPGTGLHPRPGSAASLKSYFPQIDPAWSTTYYPSRKGETVPQIVDRCAGFLDGFVPEVERRLPSSPGPHNRILLVSHAATIIGLARALLGDQLKDLRVGCCSLTVVTRKEGVEQVLGGWDAVKIADGTHLAQGSTREWELMDIEVSDGEVVNDSGVSGTEEEQDDPVGSQISGRSRM